MTTSTIAREIERSRAAQVRLLAAWNKDAAEKDPKSDDAPHQRAIAEVQEKQAALHEALADSPDDTTMTTELVDFARGAKCSEYLKAAVSGRRLDGREAELSQEIFGDSDLSSTGAVRLPWPALAPMRHIRAADTATSAPAGMGDQREQDFIGRVFSGSAASFLGVRMPSVSMGKSEYSVLTAGDAPSQLAPGSRKEASAATITATSLSPSRLTSRYIFRREDSARSSFLEQGLRSDLSRAISDAADNLVLNGSGTAPQPAGILSAVTASTAGSAEHTYADYISDYAAGIDGLHARSLMDLCVAMPPDLYQHAIATYRADENNDTAAEWAERNLGGVMTCSNLPAAASNIGRFVVYKKHAQGGIDAVMPVWGSPELIRDDVTRAGQGETAITLNLLWSFAVLRDEAYAVRSVRTGT